MALQQTCPVLPHGTQILSPRLAIAIDGDRLVAYNGVEAIYTCAANDRHGIRLAAGMLSSLDLAPDTALADALGMSRETVRRNRYQFEEGGAQAVCRDHRGPRKPYRFTEERCLRAQACLDEGWSLNRTAGEVGVSEGTLRYQIRQGRLRAAVTPSAEDAQADALDRACSPSQRAREDQACEQGVAVKRTMERALAACGELVEAVPKFQPCAAVPGAGVLLALPALLEQGLLEVTEGVFSRLRNGFYGLQAVLLTFSFMALLRLRNPEQLKKHAPGEFGLLLGLDRAPEVKTLRGKLDQMGQRGLAATLQQRFTERWAEAEPDELGILYVDGHVRIYNGRKHDLPKLHVQKRGRPMAGTQDFYVNDARAEPLFVITAAATEGLVTMLETELLPEIRNLVADPMRRITVVFDREGWSPEAFLRFAELGFDILTYRKGQQSTWQQRFFKKVVQIVDGRKVKYRLAERRVTLSNGLRVREVRRLTDNGHQTAVVTTNQELSTFEVAHRMFSRWRQENFFRYMQHEFDLDHMCTHDVEPADLDRMVAHPQRAQLDKQIKTKQETLDRVVGRRVHLKVGGKMRVQNRSLTEDEITAWVLEQEAQLRRLRDERESLPKQVPVHEVRDPKQIVQLERERKTITDVLKLIAYRAESEMARWLAPVFKRHEDEARSFLQSAYKATADLLPDTDGGTLTVRFHGLATPRATRALAGLCQVANAKQICYPGTELRLVFQAPEPPECHIDA